MTSRTLAGSSESGLVCTRYWVTLDPADPVLPILTPDFLHYNEIVPDYWKLEKPVFVSPDFTEMVFDGGLTVRVEEGEVEFSVLVENLPGPEAGICNHIVLRFLDILPFLDLAGFSTGLEGYALMPAGCTGIVNIGTSLDEQLPIVSHWSRFSFPERRVTFQVREVSRGGPGFINCLDFHLVSSCSTDLFPEESLSDILVETLEDCEGLFQEFAQLATGFYSRHIEAE